jgi:hypothetical protein
MKQAIITLYTENMKDVVDLTIPTHKNFAINNGWHQDAVLVEQENCLWDKLHLISDYLNKDFDTVLWVDADAMITNPKLNIDWILDTNENADLFLTSDINGLNAGVMYFRNTIRIKAFLHACRYYGKVLYGDRTQGEQQAIRHFSLAHPYNGIIHYFDNQRIFNSYWKGDWTYPNCEKSEWSIGDFILHLPGTPNERRVEIFTEASKLINNGGVQDSVEG